MTLQWITKLNEFSTMKTNTLIFIYLCLLNTGICLNADNDDDYETGLELRDEILEMYENINLENWDALLTVAELQPVGRTSVVSASSFIIRWMLQKLQLLFQLTNDWTIMMVYWFIMIHNIPVTCTGQRHQCYPEVKCFDKMKGPLKHICHLPEDPEKVRNKFRLYLKEDTTRYVDVHYNDIDSMHHVLYGKDIAFIVPGFGGFPDQPVYQEMKNRLLRSGYDQVIIADFKRSMRLVNYVRGMANSELAGREIGLLVNALRSLKQIEPGQVYLIGMSLGCLTVHFAGHWVRTQYGYKLGRITALDPAGPLSVGYPSTLINREDALFVDVIHTSAGWNDQRPFYSLLQKRLSISQALGHVDFYPNGGLYQPKCYSLSDSGCCHMIVQDYFLASMGDCTYTTTNCRTIDIYGPREEACTGKSANPAGSRMGFYSNRFPGRGIQFLMTREYAPYCSVRL